MEKIKQSFLKRYGIKEYIFLLIGSVVISIQVFRYATNTLGDWKMETAVFALAFMLLFAPLTILNIIRKARGLETK